MGLSTSLLLCASVLTASAACAATTPDQITVYVAPNGSNAAAGTSSAPLRTIGAAISRTPANGVVVVRSGSYHEGITLIGRSGRTITAAPGASVWLDGSKVVSNWQASGSRWVSTGWTARFDASPTFTAGVPDNAEPSWRFVNAAHPMAAHPDQVWVDSVAQRQVGSERQVVPGTFFVDYSTRRLVLGSDPSGHDVRASDLAKAMSIRDPGTTVTGINVRRFAPSVPAMGAITVERPHVTLRDMRIIDNATTGLFVGSSGARLTNLVMARNGMNGLLASHADGMRVDHVSVTRNNLERFNPAPSAGGAKIDRSSSVRISDSQFDHNYGTGLWFDESVYDFAVFGSRITDNTGHGLALEISGTGKVADNLVTGNARDGMKINDTDHVEVWNNTVAGNGRAINIVQDGRDVNLDGSWRNWALPLTLRNERVTVRNNILAAPRPSANCLLCVEDYSQRFSAAQLHVLADGNVYQRSAKNLPRWLTVWSRGSGDPAVYTSLDAMRSATGQERRGVLLTNATTSRVSHYAAASAYPAPAWLARAAHVRTGAKHLGAWHS